MRVRRARETANFCAMATLHLLLALPLALCLPSRGVDEALRLEAGPLKFQWVKDHFERPGGAELGNTHGVIVSDSQGFLYVNTDTEKAIMVYDRDGRFVRAFGADLAGGVHGMVVNQEKDGEYLYVAHHALSEWRKLTLDGRTVMKRGVPVESGKYESAAQFHPTSIAVASSSPQLTSSISPGPGPSASRTAASPACAITRCAEGTQHAPCPKQHAAPNMPHYHPASPYRSPRAVPTATMHATG